MKRKARRVNRSGRMEARKPATLLPLVAIGSSLAAAPAMALELGDLKVHSNLGQPLRASIAFALAPNEELADFCIAVSAGRVVNGLPGLGRTAISVTNGTILLTGDAAIREPMLGTRLTINCPYTPNLVRDYMLFVDPAGLEPAAASTTTPATQPVAVATAAAAPASQPATAVTRRAPIGKATRYRVQPGDSLSEIVQRIENRSIGLWPAVNAIFDANPQAFINNDPNRLKAGTWLEIPSFDGSAPVVATTVTAPVEAATAEAGAVYEPPVIEPSAPVEPATTVATSDAVVAPVTAATIAEITTAYEPAAETATVDAVDTATLMPGDVIIEPQPVVADTAPAIPTTVVSTGARQESTSLFAALVGGGLALLAGLLLFGRRIRARFGSTPIGPAAAATPARRNDDVVAQDKDTDCELTDDSPTDENPILDANLFDGRGLAAGADVEVGQDFGFAATTNLDIELPFAPQPEVAAGDETDILPPLRADMSSILESEVLPEDDDYDMSVIMDATKMPQPEDVTERDLHAIEVRNEDEDDDEFTINKESDFEMLQQDYEDELTATQALNLEIARAAEELARDFARDEDEASDETTSLPVDGQASDSDVTAEFDVTAELPLAENDETVEMPRKEADGKTA